GRPRRRHRTGRTGRGSRVRGGPAAAGPAGRTTGRPGADRMAGEAGPRPPRGDPGPSGGGDPGKHRARPDPDPDRAHRRRGAVRAIRTVVDRPAPLLRLGGPGDLLGVPPRVRPEAGPGPGADDVLPPPPGDRPGGLAAVRVRSPPDRPGRAGDAAD